LSARIRLVGVLPGRNALIRVSGLLILACTVLGLASMHTLGHHLGGQEHAMPHVAGSAPTSMIRADSMHASAMPMDSVATESGSVGSRGQVDAPCRTGCRQQLGPVPATPGSAGWWEVCVAVLGSALLLLFGHLVAARSLARGRPANATPALRLIDPRAGPPRVGLLLSSASVLRT
jgi:hypothetical protein